MTEQNSEMEGQCFCGETQCLSENCIIVACSELYGSSGEGSCPFLIKWKSDHHVALQFIFEISFSWQGQIMGFEKNILGNQASMKAIW